MAYSIFNQGQLVINNKNKIVPQLCKKYCVSEHQLILNWIISKPRMVAILRSMSFEHTKKNALSTEFQLSVDDMELIDQQFMHNPIMVDVLDIEVINYDVDDTHPIYITLQQALENRQDLKPSPVDLAREMLEGKMMKPIELIPSKDKEKKYNLLHGRIRYWAWVIAFEGKKPIPAYILGK